MSAPPSSPLQNDQTVSQGLTCGTTYNVYLVVSNVIGDSPQANYSGNPITTVACPR